MSQSNFSVIVPAAGIGARMGGTLPKQYLPLFGSTILEQTLTTLAHHPAIAHIVVVLHPEDTYFEKLNLQLPVTLSTVIGGKERCDSVLCGLAEVDRDEWVLVHDAARPCVKHEDISKLLQAIDNGCGAILAKPVVDTMKRAVSGTHQIEKSENREDLWHALTPQIFKAGELIDALHYCQNNGLIVTDEASAIEQCRGQVSLVTGSADNIKITVPEDLALAEFYLSSSTASGQET